MKRTVSEVALKSLLEGDLESKRDVIDAWARDFRSQIDRREWRRGIAWGAVALLVVIIVVLGTRYLPNRPVTQGDLDVMVAGSLALTALWFTLVAAWQMRVSWWSRARCRIVYRTLELVTSDRPGDNTLPVVLYVFRVNGRTYGGDLVHLSGPTLRPRPAWELASRYDPGAWHMCSYNPSDPSRSFLDTSLRLKYEALGLASAAILSLVWVLMLRSLF